MLQSYQLKENETYCFKFVTSDKTGKVLLTNINRIGNRLTPDSYLVMKFETGEVCLFTPKNEIGFDLYFEDSDCKISNFHVSDYKIKSDYNDDAEALKLSEKIEYVENMPISNISIPELFNDNYHCYKTKEYHINSEYIVKTRNYGSTKAVLLKIDDLENKRIFHFNSNGIDFVVSRGKSYRAKMNRMIDAATFILLEVNGVKIENKCMCCVGTEQGFDEWKFPGKQKKTHNISDYESPLPKKSYVNPVREETKPIQFNLETFKKMLIGKVYIRTDDETKLIENVEFDAVEIDGIPEFKIVVS